MNNKKMKKFCNQCGSSLEQESKFCSSCGIGVKKVHEEEVLPERTERKTNKYSKDIGGWLWLPIIGIWASLIFSFVDLFIALKSLDSFDFIFTLLILCALVYLLLLVKNRDHRLPKYYIYYNIAIILIYAFSAFIIFNTGGSSKIETWYFKTEDVYQEFFRSVVFGIIWIWYFNVSERVKLTFITGRNIGVQKIKEEKEEIRKEAKEKHINKSENIEEVYELSTFLKEIKDIPPTDIFFFVFILGLVILVVVGLISLLISIN